MTDTSYRNIDNFDYQGIVKDEPLPPLDREQAKAEIRSGLEEIRDFITEDNFLKVVDELYNLEEADRDEFVRTVLLDDSKLAERGIIVPEGMKIQRSQFGDDRPTIFCVTKLLSDNIRKVTFTFDNGLEDVK